jgi:hypothetical protein
MVFLLWMQSVFQTKPGRNGVATGRARNAAMQPNDPILAASAILTAGEADEPLESWEADDFDHSTDLGLVRVFDDN